MNTIKRGGGQLAALHRGSSKNFKGRVLIVVGLLTQAG